MHKGDLHWSGKVGCGAVITQETGRDNWRGQSVQAAVCSNEGQSQCFVDLIQPWLAIMLPHYVTNINDSIITN